MFLNDAQKILDDSRQGLQRLSDMKELQGGSLNIGLGFGAWTFGSAHGCAVRIQQTLSAGRPDHSSSGSTFIARHGSEDQLDLAITFTPNDINPELHTQPLFGTRICAIVGEHHSLQACQTIRLEQFVHRPLVLPSRDLFIRRCMDAFAQKQGMELHPAVEINDLSHIIYMVNSGRWVSMLPDAATLAVRGVVPIQIEPNLPLPTSLLTAAGVYQRKAVTEFLRLLGERTRLILQTNNRTCDVCGETFIVE